MLEGGFTAGLEASGKVRTPLWWIVYSEFGVAGSVDGKWYLTLDNPKTISTNGEIGLAIKPSIALGADAVVVDVKGGLEGKLEGKATFPWLGFENSVNVDLTGKLFERLRMSLMIFSVSRRDKQMIWWLQLQIQVRRRLTGLSSLSVTRRERFLACEENQD